MAASRHPALPCCSNQTQPQSSYTIGYSEPITADVHPIWLIPPQEPHCAMRIGAALTSAQELMVGGSCGCTPPGTPTPSSRRGVPQPRTPPPPSPPPSPPHMASPLFQNGQDRGGSRLQEGVRSGAVLSNDVPRWCEALPCSFSPSFLPFNPPFKQQTIVLIFIQQPTSLPRYHLNTTFSIIASSHSLIDMAMIAHPTSR